MMKLNENPLIARCNECDVTRRGDGTRMSLRTIVRAHNQFFHAVDICGLRLAALGHFTRSMRNLPLSRVSR